MPQGSKNKPLKPQKKIQKKSQSTKTQSTAAHTQRKRAPVKRRLDHKDKIIKRLASEKLRQIEGEMAVKVKNANGKFLFKEFQSKEETKKKDLKKKGKAK